MAVSWGRDPFNERGGVNGSALPSPEGRAVIGVLIPRQAPRPSDAPRTDSRVLTRGPAVRGHLRQPAPTLHVMLAVTSFFGAAGVTFAALITYVLNGMA